MIVSYSKNVHWETLINLHNLLQNLLPKIKFTMKYSFKEQPFLDILIKKERSK